MPEPTLRPHAWGSAGQPVVVFINAIGLSIDIAEPMLSRLGRHYRVLSWDSRVLPGEGERGLPCGLDEHLSDLLRLLEPHPAPLAGMLGWCSGAQVALRFAAQHPDRLRALVLMNPFVPGIGEPTPYAEMSATLFEKVAERPALARIYSRMLMGGGGAGAQAELDPRILEIVRRPFSTEDAFVRYALLSREMNRLREGLLPDALSVPLLTMSGAHDHLTRPAVAGALAERYPGSRLWVDETSGHYLPFWGERSAAVVQAFLQQTIQEHPHGTDSSDTSIS